MMRTNPQTLTSSGLLWLLPMSLLIRFVYPIHGLFEEKSVIFWEIICSYYFLASGAGFFNFTNVCTLDVHVHNYIINNVVGQICFSWFWICTLFDLYLVMSTVTAAQLHEAYNHCCLFVCCSKHFNVILLY